MRLACLQHVPFEGPAFIARWAAENHTSLRTVALYDGEPLPDISAYDGLVVMGGPMGANDDFEYAWMGPEKKVIAEALWRQQPLLGVCLGAQLIAAAAGSRVYPNPKKEIGWFPVDKLRQTDTCVFAPLLPDRFTAFHWHGDTFTMPEGAVHLAATQTCRNQAFAIGDHVLGLQFHLEILPEGVEALIDNCGDELVPSYSVQTAREIRTGNSHAGKANTIMKGLLDRLFKVDR